MSVITREGLNQLFKNFEDSTKDSDAFFKYIMSIKLAGNLKCLREQAVMDQLLNSDESIKFVDSEDFNDLEYKCTNLLHRYKKDLLEAYRDFNKTAKTRCHDVGFDRTSFQKLDEMIESKETSVLQDEDSDSVQQLRNRLLKKSSTGDNMSHEKSYEKQMQVHKGLQHELISDMTRLVGSLKEGATAFQDALQEDSTVLKATEIGLQVTSKSLSLLGTKLKKYNKTRVGFFFYAGCALFILLSFLSTYMIIRIFPSM